MRSIRPCEAGSEPMRLCLHLPSPLDAPEDWDPRQRARLRQIVVRAIDRAVANLRLPDVAIERVWSGDRMDLDIFATVPPSLPRGEARERLDLARWHTDRASYGLPSYDDDGDEVEIPVRGAHPKVERLEFEE